MICGVLGIPDNPGAAPPPGNWFLRFPSDENNVLDLRPNLGTDKSHHWKSPSLNLFRGSQGSKQTETVSCRTLSSDKNTARLWFVVFYLPFRCRNHQFS
ncbi:hypothetical protein J6590_095920 [Homalodisca vitripennis]|nr:hypothetical protein J6590_095920 [Homalodisca vitripennis]